MKYIFFYLRKLFDSVRDTFKVINFYQMNKFNSKIIYLKLFYIKFFYSFEFIRNLQKTNYNLINEENEKESKDFFEIKKVLNDLDEKGHSSVFKIDKKKVDDFKNIILNSNYLDVQKNSNLSSEQIIKKTNETYESYLLRMQKLNLSRITGPIDLLSDNKISKFICSKTMLKLAKKYLNTKSISVSASYFISFPANLSKTEKKLKMPNIIIGIMILPNFLNYIYICQMLTVIVDHTYLFPIHIKKNFISTSFRDLSRTLILIILTKKKRNLWEKAVHFFL